MISQPDIHRIKARKDLRPPFHRTIATLRESFHHCPVLLFYALLSIIPSQYAVDGQTDVTIVSGITFSPASTVPIGSSVYMKTTLSGSNIITGKWTKDGVVLTAGNNIQIIASGKEQMLVIIAAKSDSAGTYAYTIGNQITYAVLVVTGSAKVDGAWSGWGPWTNQPCPKTCGSATRTRTMIRTCTSAAPSGAATACRGSNAMTEYVDCSSSPCSNGTETTVTIMSGLTFVPTSSVKIGTTVFVITTLSEPNINTGKWTQNGVELSSGSNIRIVPYDKDQMLFIAAAKSDSAGTYAYTIGKQTVSTVLVVTGGVNVNGAWNVWSSWGNQSCPKTCGPATRIRVRTCTNPAPLGAGTVCRGSYSSTKLEDCGNRPCTSAVASLEINKGLCLFGVAILHMIRM